MISLGAGGLRAACFFHDNHFYMAIFSCLIGALLHDI